jgi:hypothetical protein
MPAQRYLQSADFFRDSYSVDDSADDAPVDDRDRAYGPPVYQPLTLGNNPGVITSVLHRIAPPPDTATEATVFRREWVACTVTSDNLAISLELIIPIDADSALAGQLLKRIAKEITLPMRPIRGHDVTVNEPQMNTDKCNLLYPCSSVSICG